MRNISDKICRKSQNTHLVSTNFFSPENHALYEIMWKIMVQPDRLQVTVQHGAERRDLHAGKLRQEYKYTFTIIDTYCFSTTKMDFCSVFF